MGHTLYEELSAGLQLIEAGLDVYRNNRETLRKERITSQTLAAFEIEYDALKTIIGTERKKLEKLPASREPIKPFRIIPANKPELQE